MKLIKNHLINFFHAYTSQVTLKILKYKDFYTHSNLVRIILNMIIDENSF